MHLADSEKPGIFDQEGSRIRSVLVRFSQRFQSLISRMPHAVSPDYISPFYFQGLFFVFFASWISTKILAKLFCVIWGNFTSLL